MSCTFFIDDQHLMKIDVGISFEGLIYNYIVLRTNRWKVPVNQPSLNSLKNSCEDICFIFKILLAC